MQETIFHVGKLAVQTASSPPLASVPEEICFSSLIFLKGILSDREFLVGSGTSVSIFPGPQTSSDNGVCLLTAYSSLMVVVARISFLSVSPVAPDPRFIIGISNSPLYLSLSSEQISYSISTYLLTSRVVV